MHLNLQKFLYEVYDLKDIIYLEMRSWGCNRDLAPLKEEGDKVDLPFWLVLSVYVNKRPLGVQPK